MAHGIVSATEGDWLSWLERVLHTDEVTGSSPVSPTTGVMWLPHRAAGWTGFSPYGAARGITPRNPSTFSAGGCPLGAAPHRLALSRQLPQEQALMTTVGAELDSAKQEKLRAWTEAKHIGLDCPACGSSAWAIGPILELPLPWAGGPRRTVAVLPIECTECAYLAFFNAGSIGLVD